MKRGGSLESLSTLFLMGVFALLCLLVSVMGGRVYSAVTEAGEKNARLYTSLDYIAAKVRASGAEATGVCEVGGLQALALKENYDGEDYVTYIYCLNGVLYERLQLAEDSFLPEYGERIAEAESASFTLSDGLLCAELVQDGKPRTLHLALLGGGL